MIINSWTRIRKSVTISSTVACLRFSSDAESTWTLTDQRKAAKQEREQANTHKERKNKLQPDSENYRQVKKSCRTDKREWLNRKGTEAEEAVKTLFHVVRDLNGARSNSTAPIKDKKAKVLLTHEEQNARWVEQLKEVLNQPNLLSRLFLTRCPYRKTCL